MLLLNRDFASCFWPPNLSCIYSHSTHWQAFCATVNILTVSNGEKYADPKVNYMSHTGHFQSETFLQRKEFFLLPSCDI